MFDVGWSIASTDVWGQAHFGRGTHDSLSSNTQRGLGPLKACHVFLSHCIAAGRVCGLGYLNCNQSNANRVASSRDTVTTRRPRLLSVNPQQHRAGFFTFIRRQPLPRGYLSRSAPTLAGNDYSLLPEGGRRFTTGFSLH